MFWFQQFLQVLTTSAIGEANAIKNAEIARRLKLGPVLGGFDPTRSPTSRTVSDLASYGRAQGYPIVSGPRGIFLAATPAEKARGVDRLRKLAATFANEAGNLAYANSMNEFTSTIQPRRGC